MKKNLLIALISGFLAVNGIWFWQFHSATGELTTRLSDVRMQLNSAETEFREWQGSWILGLNSHGVRIPDTLTLLDARGNDFEWGNLKGGAPHLVLLLSDRVCDSCMEQLLLLIRSRAPAELKRRMIVLYGQGAEVPAEMWIQRRFMLDDVPFYKVSNLQWTGPLGTPSKPLFFVARPEGSIADLYFHSVQSADVALLYFPAILDYFKQPTP